MGDSYFSADQPRTEPLSIAFSIAIYKLFIANSTPSNSVVPDPTVCETSIPFPATDSTLRDLITNRTLNEPWCRNNQGEQSQESYCLFCIDCFEIEQLIMELQLR